MITAAQDHMLTLMVQAEETKTEFLANRRLDESEDAGTLITRGENVFNKRCVSCHNFDRKLVGPPLKKVLQKYSGDTEKLIAFITDVFI